MTNTSTHAVRHTQWFSEPTSEGRLVQRTAELNPDPNGYRFHNYRIEIRSTDTGAVELELSPAEALELGEILVYIGRCSSGG